MFYDIFESLCTESGVTPAEVRKDLGISQSTMASWKSRGLTPNANTLVQLAEYFHTTPAYLMGNKMAKTPFPHDAERLTRAYAVTERQEALQRRISAHLDLMQESEAFMEIYNDLLSDHGKREIHHYTEYLITKPENLKRGVRPASPTESPEDPTEDR